MQGDLYQVHKTDHRSCAVHALIDCIVLAVYTDFFFLPDYIEPPAIFYSITDWKGSGALQAIQVPYLIDVRKRGITKKAFCPGGYYAGNFVR